MTMTGLAPQPTTSAGPRMAMVSSQLRTNAVTDQRVVAAMARLPREAFLPAGSRVGAYLDTVVPLGGGRSLNTPIATGRLLTAAELDPTDRVLLIGAAGGYTAALLAEIVADVVAVESDPALAALAKDALADMPAVTLVEGPLEAGAADHAPYDVLVVDGAVETLPQALVDQVKPDGRVVAGLLDRGVTRLSSGRRSGGGFALQPFLDSECALLPGFAKPRGFQFGK